MTPTTPSESEGKSDIVNAKFIKRRALTGPNVVIRAIYAKLEALGGFPGAWL